ncbi:AMP-binding protein [Streptomyces hokutonensis]|uniref:AMP-binding protein n=1 Tax=Streptomyces hokutonensis TaxID=1306990 RepID=UPI003401CCEB
MDAGPIPSLLAEFLNERSVAASCRGLLGVLSSGERLGSVLAERFHQVLPARLHNLYGPTEASIDVTSWETDPELPLATLWPAHGR